MEAIGCLVPKLWSKKHCGRRMQLFEKTQYFYVAMYLRILLCYVKLTQVLVKRQLESRQRHLEKTTVVKVGAYICVYRQKDNRIQTRSW